MSIFENYAARYERTREEEYSMSEFLQLCKKDPLTYATAHKEDGFRVAFSEIDAFDLDAASRNLRIRRRGGKTWNFTTRDDASAALASFHKDAARFRR